MRIAYVINSVEGGGASQPVPAIAKVMRDMHRLKFDKDLSFGERRLLDQARSLLMKELALAKQVSEPQLEAEVTALFAS